MIQTLILNLLNNIILKRICHDSLSSLLLELRSIRIIRYGHRFDLSML